MKKILILVCLFLSLYDMVSAQPFTLSPDPANPINLTACGDNHYIYNLSSPNPLSLTITIDLDLLNNGSSWSPPACANNCTSAPGVNFPVLLKNFNISSPGTASVSQTNNIVTINISSTASSASIDFDWLVDCSVANNIPGSAISLHQDWTSSPAGITPVADVPVAFSSFNVTAPNPIFTGTYMNQLLLNFDYVFVGEDANITFVFSNDDLENCNIDDDAINPVPSFWRLNSTGSWIPFVPGTPVTVFLNATDVLNIEQRIAEVHGCLTDCSNKNARLEWKCANADPSFCNQCQVNAGCEINYTLDYDAGVNHHLTVSRILPAPAAAPANDASRWDNSCPGEAVHWRYEIQNVEVNDILSEVTFRLSYEWQLLPTIDYQFRQLTNISQNSLVVLREFGGADPEVLDVTYADNDNCMDDAQFPLRDIYITVRDVQPGEHIWVDFETVRCCNEDVQLYNEPKYYNKWMLRLGGRTECGDVIQVEPMQVPATPTLYQYPWDIYGGIHGGWGGFISAQGSFDVVTSDLSLERLFAPVVSDISIPPGNNNSAPVPFFVETLGMLASEIDRQVVGYNETNNDGGVPGSGTMQGILRVTLSCDAGLKVMNFPAAMSFTSVDQTIDWPSIACHSTLVNDNDCTPATYSLYFDLSDPDAFSILQSGTFNFPLTGCCSGGGIVPAYQLTFDLLINDDHCYDDFNDPAQVSCAFEPACTNCCWLPLSSVGGDINLHCPGCLAPGVIVQSYDLHRSTFGFEDMNEDGIIDTPVPMNFPPPAPGVRSNFSSYGDGLQDEMVAYFADGDASNGGYDYASIITAGGRLDFLQLSRDIPFGTDMDITVESIILYIDEKVPGTSTNCFECENFYPVPEWINYDTQEQLCIPVTAPFFQSMNMGSDRRFFFTFQEADLISTALQCASFNPVTDFHPEQRYRLRVNYTVCGDFPPVSMSSVIFDDVSHRSEVFNLMWLTGIQQNIYAADPGPPDQMPNTDPGIPLDDDFCGDYLFYCESFSENHYFISTYHETNTSHVSNYLNCLNTFDVNFTSGYGAPAVSNIYQLEYRPSPFSITNLELDIPVGWTLYDASTATSFSRRLPYDPNFSIEDFIPGVATVGPSTLTLTTAEIPPTHCLDQFTDFVTPTGMHFGFDERYAQLFRFYLHATDDCDPGLSYHFLPDDLRAEFNFNNLNCQTISPACTLAYPVTFTNPPLIFQPDPELEFNFALTDLINVQNEACWNFNITNAGTTGAGNFFLAVPNVSYLGSWELTIDCGQGPVVHTPDFLSAGRWVFDLGDIIPECTVTLCADVEECPIDRNFNLLYGWNCEDVDAATDLNATCFHAVTETLSVTTLEIDVTGLTLTTSPSIYNLCDPFTVTYSVQSIQGGITPQQITLAALPSGLSIAQVEIVNCANLAMSTTLGNSGPNDFIITTADLNAIGISDFVLSNGEQMCIRVTYQSDCGYNGDIPAIELTSQTFCGSSWTNDYAAFSIGAPSGDNCPCTTCTGFFISYEEKQRCSYDFSAVIPPGLNCTSETVNWDFGDGTTGTGISVSHQYISSGTYTICYEYQCFDGYGYPLFLCEACTTITVNCSPDQYCWRIENKDYHDVGAEVRYTKDNGLFITGTMWQSSGDKDAYVARLNSNLSEIYCKRIGDGNLSIYNEEAYAVLERQGKFYVTGKAQLIGAPVGDVFVACIDPVNNSLDWAYVYGGSRNDVGVDILRMPADDPRNDQLLVIGYTSSQSAIGDYDVFAMKLDLNGNLLQVQTYEEEGKDYGEFSAEAIKLVGENEFAIVGRSEKSADDIDVLAFKIDFNLNIVPGSFHRYGFEQKETGYGILQRGDYIYLIGKTNSNGITTGNDDIYVIETYSYDLASVNSKTYGVNESTQEEGFKMINAPDGNLILIGDLKPESDYTDGIVMKLRFAPGDGLHLDPIWVRKTEGKYDESFFGINNARAGQIVITGKYGVAPTDEDIFVVKMDGREGISCCMKPIEFKTGHGEQMVAPESRQEEALWIYDKDDKAVRAFKPEYICPEEEGKRWESSGESDLSDLSVAPNPTTGMFDVRINVSAAVIKSINIYDVTGRVLKEYGCVMNGNKAIVNLEASGDGIYFVIVTAEDGSNYTRRIAVYK